MENNMNNKFTELMIITMEECGELTQACSKVLRTMTKEGDIREDALEKLIQEAADVMCMIELMEDHGLMKHHEILEGIDTKRQKLKKWSSLIPKPTPWQEILANEND
jgi:NTP pyrophosphatase (non-canonical NTP hydrolase)